ncbi:MAG: polysaccharide deacetylase family protein [Crocinitomicaceae bacterium]
METLAKYDVKATFFCVGANAKEHPELMDEMIAGGHVIGNHTMRHEKGIKTNREDYFRSISEAAEHIESNLFRPPYGRIPMAFTKELREKYHIIMWTWLSYDYHTDVTPSEILRRAETIQPGDILVLHDNCKSFEKLKEFLPELIQMLQKKGLKFAPISV